MSKGRVPGEHEGAGPAVNGGGTVYLLHLDPPLKHARHYTGWTSNLEQRLEAHRAGRGARLMEAVKEAGGGFRLVRTWAGSRALERAIKDRKEAPKLCPECTPQPFPVTKGRAAAAQASGPANAAEPERQPRAVRDATAETEIVPEPDPEAWLRPFPGHLVGPGAYEELMPLTDDLIHGWRAQLDSTADVEHEAEMELEPLLPGCELVRRTPSPLPEGHPDGHLEQRLESRQ